MTSYKEAKDALAPMLGRWKCDNTRSESIIEMMAEMGLRPIVGERSNVNDPILHLYIDDDQLVSAMKQPYNSKTSIVHLDGRETEDVIIGGGTAKSHFEMIDGRPVVITTPDDPNQKTVSLTRVMIDDELVQLIQVIGGTAVSKRYFVKQD
ncbi:uncharacterized protein [Watersipora subatra]|uniref:uncharacterized protein n=1 Tax=Watersipora subatra TaxID=2589382 RepID=UPI00355C093E